MISEVDTLKNADKTLDEAIQQVQKWGFEDIKSKYGDFPDPTSFNRKDDDTSFTPDIEGKKADKTSYFEIANRSDDQKKLVAKWKLLSTLAELKSGKLTIFVPFGAMKFTREILSSKNIEATVIKL